MAEENQQPIVEVPEIFREGQYSTLPDSIITGANVNTFTPMYKREYEKLLARALGEFPNITGYQTLHNTVAERMIFFWIQMKQEDSKDIQDIDYKNYAKIGSNFLKAAEVIIKEMRTISMDKTNRFEFIGEVVEIIQRNVRDESTKKRILQELRALARSG